MNLRFWPGGNVIYRNSRIQEKMQVLRSKKKKETPIIKTEYSKHKVLMSYLSSTDGLQVGRYNGSGAQE